MIRITTKKDGFRRAGISHTGTQEYADDAFTPEQLIALEAEPMLVVELLPDAPGPDAPGPGAEPDNPDAEPAAQAPGKTGRKG